MTMFGIEKDQSGFLTFPVTFSNGVTIRATIGILQSFGLTISAFRSDDECTLTAQNLREIADMIDPPKIGELLAELE
jgi:hypothetical protein